MSAACYALDMGCKGLWRPSVQEHTMEVEGKTPAEESQPTYSITKSTTKKLVFKMVRLADLRGLFQP